jgi:LmbE family N-acetylglucosaminyl deacetylase
MNVLAIGSHPDDIEFGCGGALTLYAQKGHDAYLYVATPGEHGGDAEVRKKEQQESARIIGARELFWGGYRDTELPLTRDLIESVEEVIKQVRPNVIFVHYLDDTHQDHRHLAQAAISASRYVPNFFFYEGPTTQSFAPSCYVDIQPVLDRKLASLEAHRSQITKTNIQDLTILESVVSCANFRGIQARVKYAEAFQVLRFLLNV